MKHLLYIDDQQAELDYYESFLKDDFKVDLELEVICYEDRLKTTPYHAILLDIHMPILDGFEAYKKILTSKFYNGCPIIFKTSYTSDENILQGLSQQCEFITPDMKPEQILLRIKNKISSHPIKYFNPLILNILTNKVSAANIELDLTHKEYKLLKLFFLNEFKVTRKDLIDDIWGIGMVVQDNTINTHIVNVRKKVEPYGITIRSTRNIGYSFEYI